MPWGKWWLQIETPGPVGTTRGRPREEVEWMRRASEITLCRLQMQRSACQSYNFQRAGDGPFMKNKGTY